MRAISAGIERGIDPTSLFERESTLSRMQAPDWSAHQLRFADILEEGDFSFYSSCSVPSLIGMLNSNHISVASGKASAVRTPERHTVRVNVSAEAISEQLASGDAVLLGVGAPTLAQHFMAVALCIFRHPVFSKLAALAGHEDLFLHVAWMDPRVHPQDGCTRPLNVCGRLAFVHSLLHHHTWHKQQVPSYPLMCAHAGLTSVEALESVNCRLVSFTSMDNIGFTVTDDILEGIQAGSTWRYLVPPEFVCLGASGNSQQVSLLEDDTSE